MMSSTASSSLAATTANSSGLDASIANVLPDVTKFLDVTTTARLSQTCRSLRSQLTVVGVDHRRRIKVPYFRLGDGNRVPPPTTTTPGAGGEDPFSAFAPRITSTCSLALSKIDFPSLKRLEFRFDQAGKNFLGIPDDELRDAFIYLAIGLESATDLEELHIDVSLVMKHDAFNSSMIYEVFARNLAKCNKLRRLKVFNNAILHRGRISCYSNGFLRALVPAIEGGKLTLEEVTLLIGNCPTSDQTSSKELEATARDLFVAILSLRRLREFHLQLNLASSPLLNIFLWACDDVRRNFGSLPSSGSIQKFMVSCVLYKVPDGVPDPLPAPCSLAPCLALLGPHATELRAFVVRVPSACWDSNSVSALKGLLSNKPNMRHLGLYFHGYECTSGRCLEYILDYIQERENCGDNLIHVSGLECYNTRFDEEEALDRYYSRQGQKCLSYDEKGLTFQARGYMIGW